MGALDPVVVYDAIERVREWYWADPERHRTGRLGLAAARREVAHIALRDVGLDDPALAQQTQQNQSPQNQQLTPLVIRGIDLPCQGNVIN